MEEANDFSGGGISALGTWKKAWDEEIHTTDFAAKRIKSAKSAKMTPIMIDAEDYYGYFQGSHGRYETFLDECPCGDFIRNKKPCKHIYRLAIELGLLDEKAENNLKAVPIPKNEMATLDETLDIVESFSETSQMELLNIAYNINSTHPTYELKKTESITELLDSEIVIDMGEELHKINFWKKADIMKLLDRENIQYKKSDKVATLKQICIENISEQAKEYFGEIITVGISPKYSPRQIYLYLHRKYEYDFYYDSELPDDNVTRQLIKRGYYEQL